MQFAIIRLMKQRGFTVIELMTAIVVLLLIGTVFWLQKNNIEVAARDDSRKTAINSMYYTLEEVYYPQNQSYPKQLNSETLPSVDPTQFKDPDGVMIGKSDSDYRYEPTNCSTDSCKSYNLRANLENEADYVKTSRHK